MSSLTRHRLGCFYTHRRLGGGGGVGSDHRAIPKKDDRKMGEAAVKRSRRDASKAFSKIYNWGHVSGQGPVKGQDRVYSCCKP